jgi:hypothetical protein
MHYPHSVSCLLVLASSVSMLYRGPGFPNACADETNTCSKPSTTFDEDLTASMVKRLTEHVDKEKADPVRIIASVAHPTRFHCTYAILESDNGAYCEMWVQLLSDEDSGSGLEDASFGKMTEDVMGHKLEFVKGNACYSFDTIPDKNRDALLNDDHTDKLKCSDHVFVSKAGVTFQDKGDRCELNIQVRESFATTFRLNF